VFVTVSANIRSCFHLIPRSNQSIYILVRHGTKMLIIAL